MIRDRGKIKWTSMMLPEHVKLLREWVREDNFEESKEVDEQYLEVINERISEAIEYGKRIVITYYRSGGYERISGVIKQWDPLSRQLHIAIAGDDDGKEIQRISLSAITDVRLE